MKTKTIVSAIAILLLTSFPLQAKETPRPFYMRITASMNGAEIPAGTYDLSWESEKTGVRVTLWKNGQFFATAKGNWVKHGVKYTNDAAILRVNSDGSRSLVEIRLAGVKKSIVLVTVEPTVRSADIPQAQGIPDHVGRTNRNFPSPVSLTPSLAGAISVGDVNGDGLPDLLFAGSPADGISGTIFVNQGNGSFAFGGSPPPNGFLLGDLNHDGKAELIGVVGSNVCVWPGTGDPNYDSTPIILIESTNFGKVWVADMDGDGNLDLIAGNSVPTSPRMIFYSHGNLQFDTVTVPTFSLPFVIADFNGDGRPDIVTPAATLLNNGNRTFTQVANNLNQIQPIRAKQF